MSGVQYFNGVSVCVFTYNVEKFLAQTLDSILAQERTFPIEIIIGDDYSTDRTREIAISYQERYPETIRLSFNESNLGGTQNWIRTISRCTGKYISIIDGDDYFCSATKLQDQFDLLEKEPGMVMCTHSVLEKYDEAPELDRVVEFREDSYDLPDIIRRGWFMRTATLFFRNGILPLEPPEWVHDYPYRYDSIIPVFLNMNGYTGNIKKVLSVWRKHRKGMSAKFTEDRIANAEAEIRLARKLDEMTGCRYHSESTKYCSIIYSEIFVNLLKGGLLFKRPGLFFDSALRMKWPYTCDLTIKRLRKVFST